MITITDLKMQRRWTLWRLESGPDGKPTKPPYSPGGFKHDITNPDNLKTYADLEPLAGNGFTGLGFALGTFDGVSVWGVDIDKCCDAVTGKFSPESRQAVIDLDTYGEFSPSGTGCHVVGLGKLPIEPGHKREVLVRPFPGAKQIEIKGLGFYFTYTDRHLSKTPAVLMDRRSEILALYDRVLKMPGATKERDGLVLTVSLTEEERFQKLMVGDMSAHNGDHSAADFALCIFLAQKHGCNAFKVDTEFRKSGLYRDKWERDDYRETTITKAVAAVLKDTPVLLGTDDADTMEDDGETEFLIENADCNPNHDGWFPVGEVSLIGAASGVGKTSWAMPLFEKVRKAEDVWGHKVLKARDYRVLLHDRSKKGMRRTTRSMHMSPEAMERVIRLTPEQQKRQPAEIMQAVIEATPGVEVWFIEGLDMWIPDMNKMEKVAPVIDSLQRIATRHNVAIIATVGAPKQKGKDRYFGRDALFGSSALARKVETVVLMGLHDEEDPNSVRRCWILPRAGRAERMYFTWGDDGQLVQTEEPEAKEKEDTSANARITAAVHATFAPGQPIVWQSSICPEASFYRWKKWAIGRHLVIQSEGRIYVSPAGTKLAFA
jgi:hypothetical protein